MHKLAQSDRPPPCPPSAAAAAGRRRYYDPDRTELEPQWNFLVRDCEVSLGAGRNAPKVVLPKVRIIAVDGVPARVVLEN